MAAASRIAEKPVQPQQGQKQKEQQQQVQQEQQQQQLPVNFGKRLAHTDKVVRDRGFRILKAWLQKHPELERLDYLKLWKGLYFAVWMADKRPVQQELAVNIALLLNDVPRDKQNMWVDTFWETMHEAWEKLDTHRINKFLLFTRIVVAEAFKALRVRGWALEDARQAGRTFTRAVGEAGTGGPNVRSMGLQLHFTRVFWDELTPQLAASPQATQEVLLELLAPLCGLAGSSHSRALTGSIHEHVLRKAPAELAPAVVARCLAGAVHAGTVGKNREALRATAEALRQVHQLPPAEAAAAAGAEAEGAGAAADEEEDGGSAAMSPLMLPRAAVDARPPGKEARQKGAKRKGRPQDRVAGPPARKAAAAGGAARPKRKAGPAGKSAKRRRGGK